MSKVMIGTDKKISMPRSELSGSVRNIRPKKVTPR